MGIQKSIEIEKSAKSGRTNGKIVLKSLSEQGSIPKKAKKEG